MCEQLSELSGVRIINLDPAASPETVGQEHHTQFIFGRDCWLIQSADVVLVYLTDDISVGGSQEMVIAKYLHKPLLALAPKEGKFSKSTKDIQGQIYTNWIHPFVAVPSDWIVETVEQAAQVLANFTPRKEVKGIDVIDSAIEYYLAHKS